MRTALTITAAWLACSLVVGMAVGRVLRFCGRDEERQ
jgi:F0F1-type ATP synthase membrane subunit c/vacuolar-type H+-ATPase subunit K